MQRRTEREGKEAVEINNDDKSETPKTEVDEKPSRPSQISDLIM